MNRKVAFGLAWFWKRECVCMCALLLSEQILFSHKIHVGQI